MKTMKNILVLIIALGLSNSIFAQKISEKEVPAAVKSIFKTHFPGVSKVKWEKEKEHFEAEFEQNKTETSALFDGNGNWLETEVEITVNQLPAAASDYIKTNYKGQKIKEAARITDASGAVTYEVEIKGKELIFDKNGTFIEEIKD